MLSRRRTLLLLTRQELVRIDLRGKQQLHIHGMWRQARSGSVDLKMLITAAFQLGPRRAGRVWVLNSEFWSGTVTLPGDVGAVLSTTELHQALGLEAESESGVSGFASRIGAVRLDEEPGAANNAHEMSFDSKKAWQATNEADSTWWLTQVSTADLTEMTAAVNSCGARLDGVAHPCAALPISSLAGWNDSTSDEIVGEEFIEAWAKCLSEPSSPALITVDCAPLSQAQNLAIQVALTIVALLGCAGVNWRTQQLMQAADRAIVDLESQQTAQDTAANSLKVIEGRLIQLRQEVAKTKQQREKLERDLSFAERCYAQQNMRWSSLLDALTVATDNDCWVQHWEVTDREVSVFGLATDNAAAHRFASVLERVLVGEAWEVMPAETRAHERNLVAFKVVLTGIACKAEVKDGSVVAVSQAPPTRYATEFDRLFTLGTKR